MCRLVSESVESSGVKQVVIESGRSVFLRPQQDTDGPALGEMLESCSDQTYDNFHPYPLTRESGLAVAADEKIHCLVAFSDAVQAVGYAWITSDGEIPNLGICVRDSWQSQGVGRVLMETLVEAARTMGKAGIALTVMEDNASAIALYHSIGFAVDGDAKDSWGPALHMTLRFATGESGGAAPSATTHDRESLCEDFLNLGLREGDLVFAHSSFKSLGPVRGGAEAVIGALADVVGEKGLVLMPSFNLAPQFARRHEVWDHASTPSSVGWITEVFRTLPGTHRSDHYSHSVAARGAGAEVLVADHLSQDGLSSPWDRAPWGKTYGTQSPMYRAYEANGKLLMLGVGYDSSTYIHLVEVTYWQQLRDSDPEAKNVTLDREKVGAFWDREGDISIGCVGDARCRLFSIGDYVDTLLKEVARDPARYRRRGN